MTKTSANPARTSGTKRPANNASFAIVRLVGTTMTSPSIQILSTAIYCVCARTAPSTDCPISPYISPALQ